MKDYLVKKRTMELLSTEFRDIAKAAGLTDERIKNLIGEDFYEMELALDQDLSWRKLPTSEELFEYLQILNKPAFTVEFNKIRRRTVVQTYKMYLNSVGEKLALLGTTFNNTLRFEPFKSYLDFEHFATNALVDYSAMDFKNSSIRHLSADAFQVFTLLIELFIEKYPSPTQDWAPDELLTFTSKSLMRIMQDSNHRTNEKTWWQHWKKLLHQTEPSQENFDMGIAQLAHKELIGYMDEIAGEEVFFIGKNLTWYLRGIVWWDKGLMLKNTENNTQFIVIAASALFVVVTEGDNDFSIFNVAGITFKKYLKKFVEIALKPVQEQNAKQNESITNSKPIFCSQCGNKLEANAKFCSNCGNKIT